MHTCMHIYRCVCVHMSVCACVRMYVCMLMRASLWVSFIIFQIPFSVSSWIFQVSNIYMLFSSAYIMCQRCSTCVFPYLYMFTLWFLLHNCDCVWDDMPLYTFAKQKSIEDLTLCIKWYMTGPAIINHVSSHYTELYFR